jgi:hypothetical protein
MCLYILQCHFLSSCELMAWGLRPWNVAKKGYGFKPYFQHSLKFGYSMACLVDICKSTFKKEINLRILFFSSLESKVKGGNILNSPI